MRITALFPILAAAAIGCGCTHALAAEGTAVAGPIGGTDLRSAQLPPAGVYGGLGFSHSGSREFFDISGNLVPALSGLDFSGNSAGAFLLYVPDIQVLGGSIGVAGVVLGGNSCGHLFETIPKRCVAGMGDPYVEVDWSRFFGTMRPSRYAGALPIAEGLTIALGFGVLVPIGNYNVVDAAQGLRVGNNIWDFAPTFAFTYMTRPIFAEGTEISARLYWNNYLTNPATHYSTGTVLNVDFAVTERIGKFQAGLAGVYGVQVADDKLFGIPLPPDGHRVEALALGGVVAYDMPEYGSFIKFKLLKTVLTHNAPDTYAATVIWGKKF
jgi:hypothetical protein